MAHIHTQTFCSENTMTGAVSTLQLLRSYKFLAPNSDLYRYEPYPTQRCKFNESNILSNSTPTESSLTPSLTTTASLSGTLPIPSSFLVQSPFFTTMTPLMPSLNIPRRYSDVIDTGENTIMNRQFINENNTQNLNRRPRSEKKPIPDDQKDEKYYERRKRNNQAAKKSRDARKIREDHIALKATMLEHENAILRAQVVTLREEAQSLRHMLLKQQTTRTQSIERSVSSLTSVTRSSMRSLSTLDCEV
ncbi:PREDICTED: hepatic leukemia factor [Polistes canadensis]|uniref:hepatic leukemia factor n=1 Tax=Polistes canadensis TaxID=91411 RepID=UPI000718D539|nr:PREDICTED: hepatic leukemia factor [Polistes canadensis]